MFDVSIYWEESSQRTHVFQTNQIINCNGRNNEKEMKIMIKNDKAWFLLVV